MIAPAETSPNSFREARSQYNLWKRLERGEQLTCLDMLERYRSSARTGKPLSRADAPAASLARSSVLATVGRSSVEPAIGPTLLGPNPVEDIEPATGCRNANRGSFATSACNTSYCCRRKACSSSACVKLDEDAMNCVRGSENSKESAKAPRWLTLMFTDLISRVKVDHGRGVFSSKSVRHREVSNRSWLSFRISSAPFRLEVCLPTLPARFAIEPFSQDLDLAPGVPTGRDEHLIPIDDVGAMQERERGARRLSRRRLHRGGPTARRRRGGCGCSRGKLQGRIWGEQAVEDVLPQLGIRGQIRLGGVEHGGTVFVQAVMRSEVGDSKSTRNHKKKKAYNAARRFG